MASNLIISTSSAARLAIEFVETDDRWAHSMVDLSRDPKQLLTSVEGTAEQDWPCSPPLQQVSRHESEQGIALLSVGMAGRSHWSASFSIDGDDALLAELACLARENYRSSAARFIGTTYEIANDLRHQLLEDGTVEIKTPSGNVLVEPVGGQGWSSRLALDGNRLTVAPGAGQDLSNRSTRWAYRIRFTDEAV